MLYTYCQECGSKNEYISQRPKFCGNCGSPLSSDAKKTTLKRKIIPPKMSQSSKTESYEEEGTDVFEVPDIKNFEYEVEYDESARRSLGSILPPPEPQQKKRRGRPRKMSQSNAKKKKS